MKRLPVAVLVVAVCGLTGTFADAQSGDLIAAAQRGDLPAVDALLKSGADVNTHKSFRVKHGTTALIEAASNGHLDVVKALLAAGADPNSPGSDTALGLETTALGLATAKGNAEVVKALLAAGADANRQAPLLTASRGGKTTNLEVVKALLAAKADPNAKTDIGATPLMTALGYSRLDVARVLVEAGASVTTSGLTPLMIAAGKSGPGSLELVQAILAAHADVNIGFDGKAQNIGPAGADFRNIASQGTTPLGMAASSGSVDIVQALLDPSTFVDVNAKQHDGKTPLALASARGRTDVVRLLLAAKADVNAADDGAKTALELASENGHADVVRVLLVAKADVNAKQPDGSTALTLALKNNHPEVAEILRGATAPAPAFK